MCLILPSVSASRRRTFDPRVDCTACEACFESGYFGHGRYVLTNVVAVTIRSVPASTLGLTDLTEWRRYMGNASGCGPSHTTECRLRPHHGGVMCCVT